MALITLETIKPKSANQSEIEYTGTGYIRLNGEPVEYAQEDSATIPLAPDVAGAIDIHDGDYDSIYDPPQTHPFVQWIPVTTAERYRVYQTPPGASQRVVGEVVHDDLTTVFEYRTPVDSGEGWHRFVVSAFDSAGNESDKAKDDWIYVYDLPELPSNMEASGTGGTFTITLTA